MDLAIGYGSWVSHVTSVCFLNTAHYELLFDVIILLSKLKRDRKLSKMSDMEDEMYVEDDEDYDLVGFCDLLLIH